jgi:poly-beta-1,6-N-acetyl-D-glucosamine synthase
MDILIFLFWFFLAVLFYAYIGYGILLYGLVLFRRLLKGRPKPAALDIWPEVTHLIAAYDEGAVIEEKILNSLALKYPAGRMKVVIVTDGSSDDTPDRVRAYPEVQLFHQPERRGKIAAVHRVMEQITSPIVVFSDANTLLNESAIYHMVRHFQDPRVGVVAGEKRVKMEAQDTASAAGEGLYWKYESKLKQWDGEWHSVMGAAGELFAIRRDLYEPVALDSVIEDFIMTMTIAGSGYVIAYEPEAYAVEAASASVGEEMKRKVRISAGAFQAMWRLRHLFNPLVHGKLSFQFISHRALRWTLAPLGLIVMFVLGPLLAFSEGGIYLWLAFAQGLFYAMGLLGWRLEQKEIRVRALFVPFYFLMMNWSVVQGFFRYQQGKQTVLWERSARKAA